MVFVFGSRCNPWSGTVHEFRRMLPGVLNFPFHRYVQSGILTIDWFGDVEEESNDFGEYYQKD